MIELTDEQRKSIRDGRAVRVRDDEREYVLLRPDVYERLAQKYDDSPWEAEEMDRLREESVQALDCYGKDT